MKNSVSAVVSDLFFMVDNSTYWKTLKNNPEAAMDSLKENSKQFCDLMENLGISNEPEDIVEDFLERA